MGGIGKGIGSVVGAGGGLVNGVLSPFGLGGEQGDYAHAQNGNVAAGALNDRSGLFNDPGVNTMLNQYANGSSSLDDVLKQESDRVGSRSTPQQQAAFSNELATNALTGSKYATDQVQNNPILGQLFGKGGALSSAVGKEQELQNQGFALTPEDHEAYGQASGNIARLFGAQEQGAAQSLADRGLAAAPSGASQVAFSGLQGNKNEMLAKSQMDIANQRMQNTMQRIGQQQQFIGQLGSQGENAIQQQYGRQLQGAQNDESNLNNASKSITAQNTAANDANMASMEDQRSAAGKTLFGAIGKGLYNGTESAAAKAPGSAVSSMTGKPPATPAT